MHRVAFDTSCLLGGRHGRLNNLEVVAQSVLRPCINTLDMGMYSYITMIRLYRGCRLHSNYLFSSVLG